MTPKPKIYSYLAKKAAEVYIYGAFSILPASKPLLCPIIWARFVEGGEGGGEPYTLLRCKVRANIHLNNSYS